MHISKSGWISEFMSQIMKLHASLASPHPYVLERRLGGVTQPMTQLYLKSPQPKSEIM